MVTLHNLRKVLQLESVFEFFNNSLCNGKIIMFNYMNIESDDEVLSAHYSFSVLKTICYARKKVQIIILAQMMLYFQLISTKT